MIAYLTFKHYKKPEIKFYFISIFCNINIPSVISIKYPTTYKVFYFSNNLRVCVNDVL